MKTGIMACSAALLFASNVFAAPTISSVPTSLADGGKVTITGSSFGSGPSNVEWLGGAGGPIESGSTGNDFSRSSWSISGDGAANGPFKYSTDQVRSGSKSLKAILPSADNNAVLKYQLPTSVGSGQQIYITWWVRANYTGGPSGQWKILRLSKNNTIVDGPSEFVWFNWDMKAGSSGTSSAQHVNPAAGGTHYSAWFSKDVQPKGDNSWYRMEYLLKSGTTGNYNGESTITRTTSSGAVSSETKTGWADHYSSSDYYNWVIFQNFLGNSFTGGTIWFDDVYVQQGSQARVELCTNSTWASRGVCEIQKTNSWDSSSINIDVNKGGFKAGANAYLFVVDSSGNASAGKQISFGGSVIGVPTPANLKVISK